MTSLILQRNAYYVALGSSFADGLGLGPRAPGSPIISQRSLNGYPQQLARMLEVPSFTDMTSSGATIRHVLKGGQIYLGPQVDALGPDTRLVTLTAGGNDVSYVGDLMLLSQHNSKGLMGFFLNAFWKGPKPIGARDFAALGVCMGETLNEIHRRASKAVIVVATYPTILPSKNSCTRLGLTDLQVADMLPVAQRLAETTRLAAHAAGAMLVDMAELSVEHAVCGNEPWVNGSSPEAGAGAAFHPTLAGAQATAQAIYRQINGLLHAQATPGAQSV